jgi:hypothetical protein
MINETQLKSALTALVMENRSAFVMSSDILAELTALRETVRALDPTFAEVLEQKRKEAEARAVVEVDRVLGNYDELLESLKNGYVC